MMLTQFVSSNLLLRLLLFNNQPKLGHSIQLQYRTNRMPPNQALPLFVSDNVVEEFGDSRNVIRCAILGCGMMGQEHASYIMGFSDQLRIDFLCDPHQPSLDKCCSVMNDFRSPTSSSKTAPTLFTDESQLHKHVDEIDLLVIASPNYLHTDTLLRWGQHDITILVEKPVAVSREQHDVLQKVANDLKARIWVAMEYRFIPAIAKLIELLDTVGDIKMVTIRENRYPFLHKIGQWNRDRSKTGDSLVEKWYVMFSQQSLF
jgi:myo-inositol 2-dehydrogenase / D-chiro-inositol 1-dehydrogenase